MLFRPVKRVLRQSYSLPFANWRLLMVDNSFLNRLLTLPTVLSAWLSPDRRWVAFEWYRVHENLDVFLVPADGSAPPVRAHPYP